MTPARKSPPWLPKRPTEAAKILKVAEILAPKSKTNLSREQFTQRLIECGWHPQSALAAFDNQQNGLK